AGLGGGAGGQAQEQGIAAQARQGHTLRRVQHAQGFVHDRAGGGTLGNISGSHVSINTLDIGLAQLAMHSSYETAGVKDVQYMIDGIRAFYETDILCAGDGNYDLRKT
ncbi:MAG: hypothetical protein IKS52_06360, partial [Clostridia bacterium]|nr:hypothetical protein [Clostridia bacterium]